jgi:hypothetical protein
MRSVEAWLEQGCDGAAIELKEDRTMLGNLEGSGSSGLLPAERPGFRVGMAARSSELAISSFAQRMVT